jgi:hypothetical protein
MEKPKFQIARVSGLPVSDTALIDDLKRVAEQLGSDTVPQKQYGKLGNYDYSIVIRRFGSWNKALTMAGLQISNQPNISDSKLFENILQLWEFYGRQPRRSELEEPPSTISQSPYNRRFGSWSASLKAFVEYASGYDIDKADIPLVQEIAEKRKTGRDPSIRLRWKTLQRDNFKCRACGASPAITPGVELHVDHITPWSKGGETVLENLQTLCNRCNLGKGNEVNL